MAPSKGTASTLTTRHQLPSLVVTSNLVGAGQEAVPGRQVTVHYTGWLYDPGRADNKGRELDSSRRRAAPLSFELGAGHVQRAWEQGVAGMRVGGRRTLVVAAGRDDMPPELVGVVPPNAAVVFDVELLEVS